MTSVTLDPSLGGLGAVRGGATLPQDGLGGVKTADRGSDPLARAREAWFRGVYGCDLTLFPSRVGPPGLQTHLTSVPSATLDPLI